MNHIELFAGCGGLSLGLEQSGFVRVLANELSPMAAETFAYNFLQEDLEEIAVQKGQPVNVKWIKSDYSDLKSRLRENPFTISGSFSDISNLDNYEDLQGNLLVGSIVDLNSKLADSPQLVELLSQGFENDGELDLVSGGPPCQSFSMAGKRERDNEKNTLPWEFARFVEMTSPRIVLLENVTGILRAFKSAETGEKFHAWFEVAKVFASIGYVPLCLHVNARHVGVPQNRPRFIMIAVRRDVLRGIMANSHMVDNELWAQPLRFFDLVNNENEIVDLEDLEYLDSMKHQHRALFENSFLFPLVNMVNNEVSVQDAIGDLKVHAPDEQSAYVTQLTETFGFLNEHAFVLNHQLRNNSPIVRRRFRLYQVLRQIDDRQITRHVFDVLRGDELELSEEDWEVLSQYDYLHEDGELRPFDHKVGFENYLASHPTRKQTQKALVANEPAPAALSIPDDACHYDENELRVLSVREMARIQSFPDNFVFRSKITTGGQMRKFEVPQYTQVGNAVPPLLGVALGQIISGLLERA
ncbi:TPA: DNA cytosine methyltransferase [Vibrio alginolyticus]